MKNQGGRKPGWKRWGAPAAALLLLAGCGEQKLYRPPTAPIQVIGRLKLPSEAQDVSVLGETAFVAGGQAGLHIVDLSDPRQPVFLKTIDTVKFAETVKAASTAFGGSVVDIAFVVEGTEGITTYDVSDPSNAFSFNQGTTAVDGNGMFVELPDDPSEPYVVYLAESWKGMRIFESSPATPGLLAYNGVFADTRGFARAVSVRDGFAYVADDEMGLAILDVRTRFLGSVQVVSSCDTDGYARGVAVEGNYAFLADYHGGLVVMELVDGTNASGERIPVPILAATLALGGRSQSIVVRDGLAFLAAQDGGVHVVDVSIPSSPEYLGTVVTPFANGLSVAENGLVVVSDRDEGLLVLGGLDEFDDVMPPSKVWTLDAAAASSNAIRLEWTAPGDDGLSGNASEYDIRFRTGPIASAEDWDSAAACAGEPYPSKHGTKERFWVDGLALGTEYRFALRTSDEAGNWSPISNLAEKATTFTNVPCAVTEWKVTPGVGAPGTNFIFEVIYTDWDGDPPVEATIVLDGTSDTLDYVSGSIRDGALYRFARVLDDWGQHEHFYRFGDGRHPPVVTNVIAGPGVGYVFTMGSPANERGRDMDEVLHEVALTREVWFSDHEVTQAEYETVTGTNPSRFRGGGFPVENVSWYDAVLYCNTRSRAEGFAECYSIQGASVVWNESADGYRLPTEAEWERACRAGTNTAFFGGDLTNEGCGLDPVLDPIGWYCGNSARAPHAVRGKQPNAWGLYDMHGNVWEWCWDWYQTNLGTSIAIDPKGPETGSQKVVRGGSWYYFARECRSAARAPYWPNSRDDVVGFRVVRTLVED